MRTVGLILAAGKSSRFKGEKPKFLHALLGKRVIDYVTEAISPFVEDVFYVSSPEHIVYPGAIIQKDPRGTGHAVLKALPSIRADKVLIAYGDTPFISPETIQKMCSSKAPITLGVFRTKWPDKPYGRVDPQSKKIIQYKDASGTEKENPLCHAGIMMVDYNVLSDLLPQVSTNNKTMEYYLTDVVNLFEGSIELIEGSEDEFMGIDTRQDLAIATKILNQHLIKKHMANGVTFQNPDSTYLSYDTQLGVDVEVGAHVVFGTHVIIESGTRILPFCYLENCHIQSQCQIGPFAHIRGQTELAEGVEIGNFVEVKKSKIGKKSKAKHHTYLGDAVIGERVNIGAGTITCNYDGKHKFQTIIKDDAFIGSNVNLIAPITVGTRAYIGAGGTVSKDVPNDTLVVERAEEKRKPRCDKS